MGDMVYKISTLTALRSASAILRGHLKTTLGYIRYLYIKPTIYDFNSFSILQLLIHECGLPLNKTTLNRLLNRNPTVVRFNDDTRYVTIDLEDFYHASMCYEKKTLTFILKLLTNGGVFVDVGANIGGYTVRAAKTAHVYAIEPHPRNFHLLELNVKLNHVQNNVRALQIAAASSLGKAKLVVSNYHGRHSLIYEDDKGPIKQPTMEIDTMPLDFILANEDHINVIKIDVEGAEPLVLKGAKEVLKRTEVVVIEATLLRSFFQASKILTEYSFKPLKKLDNNVVFAKSLGMA
jgi:FkbM family methyltransferase